MITDGIAMMDHLKDAHGVRTIGLGGARGARPNAVLGRGSERAVAALRADAPSPSMSAVRGTIDPEDADVPTSSCAPTIIAHDR